MTSQSTKLRHRIQAVEARVASRQQRIRSRWQETQRAGHRLLQSPGLIVLAVATGALLIWTQLRGGTKSAAGASGVLGLLATTGLTMLRQRYGSPYALIWRLLNRSPAPPGRHGR